MKTYKKIENYYFDNKNPIGKGGFSEVFEGHQLEDENQKFAIKVLSKQKWNHPDDINLLNNEIDILRQIYIPNIVRLYNASHTSHNYYIMMEYCNGGDLDKIIKNPEKIFTEEEALKITKQITSGFLSLTDLKLKNQSRKAVLHRDIKPSNIFFHDDCVKIGDFDFCTSIDAKDLYKKKGYPQIGTPNYMSPQVLNQELYSGKCDIWSAGIVLYEMLFKQRPWHGTSLTNLHLDITYTPLNLESRELRNETKDLIQRMLEIKEEDRIEWKAIHNHPAIRDIAMPQD